MGLRGRFFSEEDMRFINSINTELYEDIIQCVVEIHKFCPDNTNVNIYGESSPTEGKYFFPGVSVTALVQKQEIETPTDEFGTDRKQIITFKFREENLKSFNLYPEIGDIIIYNERLHEIDGVNQEQFLGSIPEKSLSIICNCHYSKLSKNSMFIRQG